MILSPTNFLWYKPHLLHYAYYRVTDEDDDVTLPLYLYGLLPRAAISYKKSGSDTKNERVTIITITIA